MEFLASLAVKALIGTSVCGSVTIVAIHQYDRTLLGFKDNTQNPSKGKQGGNNNDGEVAQITQPTVLGSQTGQDINTSEDNPNTNTVVTQAPESNTTSPQGETQPVVSKVSGEIKLSDVSPEGGVKVLNTGLQPTNQEQVSGQLNSGDIQLSSVKLTSQPESPLGVTPGDAVSKQSSDATETSLISSTEVEQTNPSNGTVVNTQDDPVIPDTTLKPIVS